MAKRTPPISSESIPLTLCAAWVTAVLAVAPVSQQALGRVTSHYANPRIEILWEKFYSRLLCS